MHFPKCRKGYGQTGGIERLLTPAAPLCFVHRTHPDYGQLSVLALLRLEMSDICRTVMERTMQIKLSVFLASMILMSGIAFGQTIIDEIYFPTVADGGGYTTQLTISHAGGEIRTVMIRFLGSSGAALPITTLDVNGSPGLVQNCGAGCFAFTMGPGGYESVFGVTPGERDTMVSGYARVTVLAPVSPSTAPLLVTVSMALTFGGFTAYEPFLRDPALSFTNPFTNSPNTYSAIVLINPQTTAANIRLSLYDNAEPPNFKSIVQMWLPPGNHSAKFLDQVFTNLVQSGSVAITSSVPIFVWPATFYIDSQMNLRYYFFAVNPSPQLTGIQPAGVMAGGPSFDLEVYGQDFSSESRVWWDGQVLKDDGGAVIAPIILSSRQLRVRVPASYIASAKAIPITVFTPEPGGGQSSAVILTVSDPAPVLTGLSLQSVPAGKAGYEVGIYGARFVKDSAAEWNGSARATQFVSSSRLVMTLQPADIAGAGTGTITVLNPGGSRSNGRTLEIVALVAGSPEITRLIPDVIDASAGAFTLTVEGSGFVAGSKVLWNGVEKTTHYESTERLSADILAIDLGEEMYLVTVRNPSQAASNADAGSTGSNTAVVSNRNKAPLLEGLSPSAVVAGSGAFQLRIRGWGYAAGKTMVSWNTTELQSMYASDEELTVDIPAAYVAMAGGATVGVENPAPGGGSQTKTFTILENTGARESLMYPRLVNEGGGEESTGVVWANLSGTETRLTAWAYGNEGGLIEGQKIINPVAVTVSAEEQQAIMDWQVFGETFREGKQGWLKLDSTQTGMVGFFMMFNDEVTYTDGANALQQGMKEFVFTEIEDEAEGFIQINIANPAAEAVNVRLELRDKDGGQKGSTVERTIEGHGTIAEPLTVLFNLIQPAGSDYIRVVSDGAVAGYEYLGKKPKYVYGLNGQDAQKGGTVLYGPQYVVGGNQYRTTLSIVNLEDRAGMATLRLINAEGVQIGSTRELAIKSKGKLEITDQNFFLQPSQLTAGYLEIRSDGPRLAGNLVFVDPEQEVMASSLPLVTELAEEMVFGHVVSNALWWTGIALLNPWPEDAQVMVILYDRTGKPVGEKRDTLKAGHQQVGVLWQYFDWLKDKDQQGYIRVKSDKGLAGLALFGTNQLSVISAIPAQTILTQR